MAGKKLPESYRFLLDPDYKFTHAYGLRWDAPQETAYPTSMVIGKDGQVKFARVSKTHGGRVPAAELLKAISAEPN